MVAERYYMGQDGDEDGVIVAGLILLLIGMGLAVGSVVYYQSIYGLFAGSIITVLGFLILFDPEEDDWYCAKCGQYLGQGERPGSCDRCGSNRLTTEDPGAGDAVRVERR
jgi:DNA-directed RNA polymerase subunit RPC12/RpoP